MKNIIPMKKTLALSIPTLVIIGALSSTTVFAKQSLTATLDTYPGSSLPAPNGEVTVNFDNDILSVQYNMANIAPSSKGGIHIHTGTSCDDATKVGGHYWAASLGDDIWNHTLWESDEAGNAKGKFTVKSGYNYEQNISHALVIHNSEGGRIACGVLQTMY